MSLLSDSFVSCHIMDKATVADGYGGVTTTWTEGAEIKAAIVDKTPSVDLRAQEITLKGVYTIVTEKTVVLRFNDVIRRDSDGLMIRVTSDGVDRHTPASAMLNMRTVTGEAFISG